jgi:hypothetical protein
VSPSGWGRLVVDCSAVVLANRLDAERKCNHQRSPERRLLVPNTRKEVLCWLGHDKSCRAQARSDLIWPGSCYQATRTPRHCSVLSRD